MRVLQPPGKMVLQAHKYKTPLHSAHTAKQKTTLLELLKRCYAFYSSIAADTRVLESYSYLSTILAELKVNLPGVVMPQRGVRFPTLPPGTIGFRFLGVHVRSPMGAGLWRL